MTTIMIVMRLIFFWRSGTGFPTTCSSCFFKPAEFTSAHAKAARWHCMSAPTPMPPHKVWKLLLEHPSTVSGSCSPYEAPPLSCPLWLLWGIQVSDRPFSGTVPTNQGSPPRALSPHAESRCAGTLANLDFPDWKEQQPEGSRRDPFYSGLRQVSSTHARTQTKIEPWLPYSRQLWTHLSLRALWGDPVQNRPQNPAPASCLFSTRKGRSEVSEREDLGEKNWLGKGGVDRAEKREKGCAKKRWVKVQWSKWIHEAQKHHLASTCSKAWLPNLAGLYFSPQKPRTSATQAGEMKVSTSTVAALFSKMALTGQRIAMVDMVLLVFPAFPCLP